MMFGYIEKDWGINFPKSYLWCQANSFDKEKTSLFLSIADVPFKKINFRGFICAFLVNGKEYRFATYNSARVKHVEINGSGNIVSILIKKNRYRLYINIQRKDSLQLIAPSLAGMKKTITESINSEMKVRLLKGSKILFEGTSLNTGLEIV